MLCGAGWEDGTAYQDIILQELVTYNISFCLRGEARRGCLSIQSNFEMRSLRPRAGRHTVTLTPWVTLSHPHQPRPPHQARSPWSPTLRIYRYTTNARECFLFRSCTNWYLESFPQPDNLVLFVNIYNNGLNWPRINWLQTGFCLNILKCIYKFKCHWTVAIN